MLQHIFFSFTAYHEYPDAGCIPPLLSICYLSLFIEQCLILTATKELRLFIPYYVLKAVIVLDNMVIRCGAHYYKMLVEKTTAFRGNYRQMSPCVFNLFNIQWL